MAKLGEHQRRRDIRTFFQHATEAEFVSAAELATGRKVRAFVSVASVEVHSPGMRTAERRALMAVVYRSVPRVKRVSLPATACSNPDTGGPGCVTSLSGSGPRFPQDFRMCR